MQQMNVVAIIQARGGSKGIPGKNIKMLAGKPLIAWTIEVARASKNVTRTIVSTDSEEIANVAKEYGAEVPFMRPAELASDSAKSVGLLRHALEWLQTNEGYIPDAVVQLKPTNPLRTADHIDESVDLFFENPDVDAVVSVVKAPIHPLKTWKLEDGYLTPFIPETVFGIHEAAKSPRQQLPEAHGNNSAVHVINPRTILEKNSSIGDVVRAYVMTPEDSINIDTSLDFEIAEFLMNKRNV
jgi:CMP-N,N'-diacetyllegionaminic acid synthase